jgi:hypothetical protein
MMKKVVVAGALAASLASAVGIANASEPLTHFSVHRKADVDRVGHYPEQATPGDIIRIGGSFTGPAAEDACGVSPATGATFYSSAFAGSKIKYKGVPAVHAKVDILQGMTAWTRLSKSLRLGKYVVKLACKNVRDHQYESVG